MINEDQLYLKQMSRRMTSLQTYLATLQSYHGSLFKTLEHSPDLQYVVGVTLDSLSLMMAAAAVLQSEMDRLYWTNDLAPLRSLRAQLRTALESLSDWAGREEPPAEDCDCQD